MKNIIMIMTLILTMTGAFAQEHSFVYEKCEEEFEKTGERFVFLSEGYPNKENRFHDISYEMMDFKGFNIYNNNPIYDFEKPKITDNTCILKYSGQQIKYLKGIDY